MKVCSLLFNDINFEPDAIQPCCNVHAISVPRFPFTGGPVDMESYAHHISTTLDNIQARSTTCLDCPDLIDIEHQENQKLRIQFKTVSINMHRYLCNCKCVYCDLWNHKSAQIGYDILPALISLKEQHTLHDKCYFSWGGGEASILPNFEEASAWISGQGYWQYIHTNALLYSPTIAAMLRNSLGAINISLDSASPEIYKAVKGVDAFTRVVENIQRYSDSSSLQDKIHLKYIIFEKNNSLKEIEGFLDLCQVLRVTSVQASLNFKELNGAGPNDKTLLATAFLMKQAKARGIACMPFFIPQKWLSRIESVEKKYLG